LGRPDLEVASGFQVAKNYYYHSGHAWARIEYGGFVRVGLDDFAGRLFGPFNRFDLPRIGQVIRQGEPGFGFIRGDLGAKCRGPLEGVVVAVNPEARENGRIADDPYGRGWLFVLEPQKLVLGLRNLLFMDESLAWMEDEVSRLIGLLPGETEYPLAATGGLAVSDIFGRIEGLSWEKLTKEFLGT
jgi:glycine cleavage system H lipoate-binding protein